MKKFNDIEEINIKSASEMFDVISNELINRNNNLVFRGQINEEWKLESTLMRYINGIVELKLPQNERLDKQIISKLAISRLHDNFKKNLIINNDLTEEKIENTNLWEYGQHFGLPTPLLDWTKSPFIALFFALGNKLISEEGKSHCIHVLNIDMIQHLNKEILDKIRPKNSTVLQSETQLNEQYPTLDIITKVSSINKRLSYQQGLFTHLEFYNSIEVWLNIITKELTKSKTGPFILKKYTFPTTELERIKILDKLDAMNINYRTLFPDIEGSVKGAIDETTRAFTSPIVKYNIFSL